MVNLRLFCGFFAVKLVFFLSCSSSTEQAPKRGASQMKPFKLRSNLLEYRTPEFELTKVYKDGQNYTKINFMGSVFLNRKGYAKLPYASVAIQLQPDKGLNLELSHTTSYQEYTLDYPLLPAKGIIYRNQNPADIPHEIDHNSLNSDWYPGNIFNHNQPFIIRNIRGVNIAIFPFQYNAEEKILRVYKNISLKIGQYNSGGINSLSQNTHKNRTILPIMDNLYKSLFLNYQPYSFTRNVLGDIGDILVIYTKRDEEAISPYIDWKRKKGFKVHTKIVPKGINVKSIISEMYQANPKILYVQLVGDWDDIKSDLGPEDAPTDPMLGCVAGDDYYADLIIGRFSGNSARDIEIQVKKTIYYEKNPDPDGEWYTRGLGIGSDEGDGDGDDGESDFIHIDNIKKHKLLKYTYNDIIEAYEYPTTEEVDRVFNSGLSIINYAGHGLVNSWVTSNYSNREILKSSNGDRLPVIISVACVNGAFHSLQDSFAESFLKAENGGAIATLMSTINQPWNPPMRGQDYMNDLLIGGYDYSTNPGNGINTNFKRGTFGSITHNGMILMFAESNKPDDLETIQTWTLFGDASLEVRTSKPQQIRLANLTSYVNGVFSATVLAGKKRLEGALVALSRDDQTFSGVTDKNGNVTISHNLSIGSAEVVVTGSNLRPLHVKDVYVH